MPSTREYFAFSRAAPKPCTCCNKEELDILHRKCKKGGSAFWIYKLPSRAVCSRCEHDPDWLGHRLLTGFGVLGLLGGIKEGSKMLQYVGAGMLTFSALKELCRPTEKYIEVPLELDTVGVVERAIHGAVIGEKGSDYRAHGTFIKHLSGLPASEEYRQALCAWAPTAMMAYMEGRPNVKREMRRPARSPPGLDGQDSSTAAETSATLKQEGDGKPLSPSLAFHLPANEDCQGSMKATHLNGDEYGPEDRLTGDSIDLDPKRLAFQIGPDLIPTEVMGNTVGNMKAGLAKRVKPLPFQAEKDMIRKIDKTVTALIARVFNRDAINKFREENPDFDEFKSSKWSSSRWTQAWDEALQEQDEIEQTFQIKVNEALPAKGKAPRPIIQCGDKAQVLMKYPVKCFEHLLFDFFEDASIKHLDKHDAMGRIAKRLRQPQAHIIEGDGSAWDACCNHKIRGMTENRIIRHIITALGEDPQVPHSWMRTMLEDMEKKNIKGKVKNDGWQSTPLKVIIEAIRQSGHAGTSCFNWLINFVCWICVVSENPWDLISKDRRGELASAYISAFSGEKHYLKYAFEGDDSAISTTENLRAYEEKIEKIWTQLGFRMKLVYVTNKMTFTGFDFLCDDNGPTGEFIPEIARNIASSSWSCSSELKMHPDKLHQIGAAAMLARAINFKDCGPYMRYFAALGIAHIHHIQDFALEETEAKRLGIQVSPSVEEALQECFFSAEQLGPRMQQLVDLVAPFDTDEQQLRMLACSFGADPFDDQLARDLVPFTVWNPANFSAPRRE